MNIATIKTAIAGVVQNESGLTPVWEYEYGTAPTPPYIVLNITGIETPYKDARNYSGEGTLDIQGSRDITVSVRCFGDGRIQYLTDLMICLLKPSSLEDLSDDADLALISTGAIKDITPDLEDQTVACAQMDISLRTHDALTIEPSSGGYIETVHAEGDLTY